MARDVAGDMDLAKRSPVLGWTWFNHSGKTKRSPVLAWTWFNHSGKTKRSPVLGWTWFNSGGKQVEWCRPVVSQAVWTPKQPSSRNQHGQDDRGNEWYLLPGSGEMRSRSWRNRIPCDASGISLTRFLSRNPVDAKFVPHAWEQKTDSLIVKRVIVQIVGLKQNQDVLL
ncbi:hypothetical protein A1O1_06078 [Capronia coronata CBS 617.96]|uniref:Uncharacterized protein n=1 Tax=Capronia coronata CBS 617.96 TaxID=1182541 RepID=W9Y7U5_9EURO|nr:uncharacterized protein A1O1_06078 [Capronia coronata CBS 617.96]EXJ85710.1 hypothetical protein A1O1_06078 [Capronia coronata CBS 617.96]